MAPPVVRGASISELLASPLPLQAHAGADAVVAGAAERPDVVPVEAKLRVRLVRFDVVEDHCSSNPAVRLALDTQRMQAQVVRPELAPPLGLVKAVRFVAPLVVLGVGALHVLCAPLCSHRGMHRTMPRALH